MDPSSVSGLPSTPTAPDAGGTTASTGKTTISTAGTPETSKDVLASKLSFVKAGDAGQRSERPFAGEGMCPVEALVDLTCPPPYGDPVCSSKGTLDLPRCIHQQKREGKRIWRPAMPSSKHNATAGTRALFGSPHTFSPWAQASSSEHSDREHEDTQATLLSLYDLVVGATHTEVSPESTRSVGRGGDPAPTCSDGKFKNTEDAAESELQQSSDKLPQRLHHSVPEDSANTSWMQAKKPYAPKYSTRRPDQPFFEIALPAVEVNLTSQCGVVTQHGPGSLPDDLGHRFSGDAHKYSEL